MANEIIIHLGRTNKIPVSLGFNVSADTFTSEIRAEPSRTSPLIATFTVTKPGGGTDGELLLTLDDSATVGIDVRMGYMDLKRMNGTEPVAVFDQPIEVIFRDTVTA